MSMLDLLASAALIGLAATSVAAVLRKALSGEAWLMLPVPEKLRALIDAGKACDACSSAWATLLVALPSLCFGVIQVSTDIVLIAPAGAGIAYRLLRSSTVKRPTKSVL